VDLETFISGILNSKDFFENLILVIAPVLITIYGSNRIISSWQMQKEKSELRKSILHEFDQTHPKLGQFMFEMFYKIRYSYIDYSRVRHDQITTSDILVFPSDKHEQPLSRFGNMLNELLIKQSEFNAADTKFRSTIMTYFDNIEDFSTTLQQCNEFGHIIYKLLHEIIYSTDESEFKRLYKKFEEIHSEQQKKFAVIRIMIIYEKLKNLDKGMSPKFIEGFSNKSSKINKIKN